MKTLLSLNDFREERRYDPLTTSTLNTPLDPQVYRKIEAVVVGAIGAMAFDIRNRNRSDKE